MRKLAFFLFASFLFAACGDDEAPKTTSATVNLHLLGEYNGEPFVLFQAFDYPSGNDIRFQNFNFFASNITLLGEGTTPDYKLSAVEFFDFKDNLDLASAETPLVRNYENVPIGTYKGIKIDFGVSEELNNAQSGNLPSDNPLRQAFATHYWSDWDSYIFMKSEGIYDKNGDGTFNQSDQGFEHHPGMDDVYTSVTKLKSITLEDGQTFDLDLVADVFDIYVENGVALDLADPNNQDTQSLGDLPLAKSLMGHWATALKF
ncbi:MAG: hypothetical protein IPN76_23830 [Saprospiraceae bacterium]|nr:hypothetical protein [Saprospiraceae bacterium]